jgi:preflagellin peptidase FlaK
MIMQTSITKGLPGVSTEDLKSRLSSDEIESIKIWAKATHTKKLTIVKKIPFAIFISIGMCLYGAIWGLLL